MWTRHSQKKGWFSNFNEANSVMNDNKLKPELLCGHFGNSFQLVLGHFPMRIIIDSVDFTAIFKWSDYPPKIDNRPGAGDIAHVRR
jgi:hypothetical protein